MPEPFYAVGEWYSDFSQTSDADVRDLLARADARRAAGRGGSAVSEPDEPASPVGETDRRRRSREPPAPSLVRSGRAGHRGHRAGVGLRPVRCGGGPGRRLQATRSRRRRIVRGRQGRAIGYEPGRGPGRHPTGLARQPPPHRHCRPAGPPAGDPGRHGGRPGLHRGRGSQPGLLVVRRHLRVRPAAPERDQRIGRGDGGRGDVLEGSGGGRGPDRRGLRGGRGALGHRAQPGRGRLGLPRHLRPGGDPAGRGGADPAPGRGAEPFPDRRGGGRTTRRRSWAPSKRRTGAGSPWLALVGFVVSVITGPANSFVFLYAQDVVHLAGYVTALMVVGAGVTGLLGLLAGRWLADHVGRRPTCTVGLVAIAADGRRQLLGLPPGPGRRLPGGGVLRFGLRPGGGLVADRAVPDLGAGVGRSGGGPWPGSSGPWWAWSPSARWPTSGTASPPRPTWCSSRARWPPDCSGRCPRRRVASPKPCGQRRPDWSAASTVSCR